MRKLWLLAAVSLCLGVYAAPNPEASGALKWFLNALSPCIKVVSYAPYRDCVLPPGKYCLYYANDPKLSGTFAEASLHDFGWYSEAVGCGALYEVVHGVDYTPCLLKPDPRCASPAKVLPPDPAWAITIPKDSVPVGLWLNAPYDPRGALIKLGGLYYTCRKWNRDGKAHSFIYKVEYELVSAKCPCICDGSPGPGLPAKGEAFLIFWEDGCGGGDMDWNDFMAALIPVR